MKKLFLLAVLATLTAGVTGCRFWDCMFHGSAVPAQPCYEPVMPCEPCGSPCSSCSSCSGAPVVTMPGPETYVPAR
ncbi:MAG: hypothetical protein ACLQNE_17490 [Thermoguttaceae bacterium]|jgi:hypothetical protein